MVGHFPVFQILLQIEVKVSIMASPHAWTNAAGMLSTPRSLLVFSGGYHINSMPQYSIIVYCDYGGEGLGPCF